MSASFYDLMKYARTGIASPEMTGFDKVRARAAFPNDYPLTTLTGIPPISFKSDGKPLSAWSIAGNMVQDSVPSPDSPVVPQECGDRTGNLWIENASYVETGGVSIERKNDGLYFSGRCTQSNLFTTYCDIAAGDYTLSANANRSPYDSNILLQIYKEGVINKQIANADAVSGKQSFTVTGAIEGAQLRIRVQQGADYDGFILRPMLNTGSTALPYAPYGYKCPISCAGQTTPIYLPEPLRKIGDYADSVSSDGTVTRRVKKYEFTGEENIIADRSYSRFRFRLIDSFSLGIRKTPIICSHYQSIADGRPIADVPDNSIYSDSDSQSGYWYIKTTDYSAADDFKAFLATQYANGTPVTVWYVLANPVTETVTAPTITTAKGANTLTVDTTLQPSGVSITGNIKQA